jgi:hypothetical protein
VGNLLVFSSLKLVTLTYSCCLSIFCIFDCKAFDKATDTIVQPIEVEGNSRKQDFLVLSAPYRIEKGDQYP